MKFLAVALALVAAAQADVSHLQLKNPEANADIVRQAVDVAPNAYNWNYETSNGIAAQESGQLTNLGSDSEAISVQGDYSYTAPNGSPIALSYVADANGFQPQGAHLPTPPPTEPIPEYIQRSIAYNAAHQEKEKPAARPASVASASAFVRRF